MGNKLYVGNLSYGATEEDVAGLFATYGQVEEVKLITDRETGRAKGFGFVTFASEDSAHEAIEAVNGTVFQDRKINVTEAKPQAPRAGGRDNSRGHSNQRGNARY